MRIIFFDIFFPFLVFSENQTYLHVGNYPKTAKILGKHIHTYKSIENQHTYTSLITKDSTYGWHTVYLHNSLFRAERTQIPQ